MKQARILHETFDKKTINFVQNCSENRTINAGLK